MLGKERRGEEEEVEEEGEEQGEGRGEGRKGEERRGEGRGGEGRRGEGRGKPYIDVGIARDKGATERTPKAQGWNNPSNKIN